MNQDSDKRNCYSARHLVFKEGCGVIDRVVKHIEEKASAVKF